MSEQRLLETALTYPGQGRALVALASRLADGGRGRDALALLRKGGDKGPKSSAAWIEAGLIYDAEGRFAEALASYRRSLLVDSNNAWARGCLAWAELRRGRLGRAYYQARRALRLDPRYADALTIIAGVQRRLGLVGRAESSLVSAIALDRQRSWAYLELARLKYDGGDGPAALNVLTDFLTISPNDEDALALLARLSGS
jgi:tetratricopeptide (TPR) repeat protein